MKVEVIKTFRDKHTKDLHEKGKILKISNERYEEINSTSHGFLVKALEPNYNSMTKKELVEIAKEKGIELDMRMTKGEMVKELA